MNINPSPLNSVASTPVKGFVSHSPSSNTDYPEDLSLESSGQNAPSAMTSSYQPIQSQSSQQRYNKHPHNVTYDPQIHTSNKPPYSFSCLIFMAIEDSVQKALPVKDIYAWILDHFPYFKNAPTGWKNSVRHNLSLNKCFQKVEKAPNLGKGSLWTVDPQYKPNLIQALSRSPLHPCTSAEQGSSTKTVQGTPEKPAVYRLPNPDLFPYLSKKLAATEMNHDAVKVKVEQEGVDSKEPLNEADAAAVMLSLKNGTSNHRREGGKCTWQVITTSPSQDHTYSAAENGLDYRMNKPAAAVAGAEPEDDRLAKSRICRKIDFEDEEERKIQEGAETLLNLANITMKRRNIDFLNSIEQDNKKMKFATQTAQTSEPPVEKTAPFKPRLLRTKKKNLKQKVLLNNNVDEWVKHRREIENRNR
ncbi:unnamed protein product [Acanthoscelides obtectus]|nr:unnamed protein product [Acanthoscelides obtectus]CAK1644554.1 Forkhead box protein N3 [Acanthoscelides obtectus]